MALMSYLMSYFDIIQLLPVFYLSGACIWLKVIDSVVYWE